MRNTRRSWWIWGFVFVGLVGLMTLYQAERGTRLQMPQSELAALVRQGAVQSIAVSGDETRAIVTLRNPGAGELARRVVLKERGVAAGFVEQLGLSYEQLDAQGVKFKVDRQSNFTGVGALVSTLVPFLLMIGLLAFMMRQAQSGSNQALSFGRSRARLLTGDTPTVTFSDVAGVDESKQELAEIVEFLREPEKFIALGAKIPRGVLMMGPPGCGKTLLAKAIAGEAGVPFFSISGSEFVEMFVGVGASRVRDLFDQARKNSPCIVFIDEIDAVGRQRGAGLGGSHDEREQTLNQILVEMDGFDTDTNVIIVAATNRPDILDPALLRPGRFDRRVVIDRPDVKGRRSIIEIHARGKPLSADVDLDAVAKQTPGFSGADLENLVNESAIQAARRNARQITNEDIQQAVDKVRFGPERKSRTMEAEELKITAYHEAGHAVVMHVLEECDPVHRVTIIPRGMTGGLTSSLPESDTYLRSSAKFRADLAAALGGRAAEVLVFGEVSTGASGDLEFVTKTARDMVTRYGMSESLGPITFGQKQELVFLGRELSEQRNYSEAVARQIDHEVRRLVTDAYDRAVKTLRDNLDRVHAVARKLLEVETLDRDEFVGVMSAAG